MADAGSTSPPTPTGLVAPQPDISIAGRFQYTCIVLGIVVFCCCGWQLYAELYRLKRKAPKRDKAVALLPTIAAACELGLLWAATRYGFGQHNSYFSIDDQIKGGLLVQISQFPHAWGVALGKISIAGRLLSVKPDWKLYFWPIIGVQPLCALAANAANITQLVQCKPISASWDPRILETCPELKTLQVALYAVGAIDAATGLLLGTIHITFLFHIRMPLPRKVITISFMCTGVFVVPAVIVKLTYVDRFGKTGDWLYGMVDLAIWSMVEVLLGIFAACAPMLSRPVGNLLEWAGLRGAGDADVRRVLKYYQQTEPEYHLGALPSNIASTSSQQGILGPTMPKKTMVRGWRNDD
ncbi:hypothetical protein V8F33_014182 [Rhypophila sp. PSN 637]